MKLVCQQDPQFYSRILTKNTNSTVKLALLQFYIDETKANGILLLNCADMRPAEAAKARSQCARRIFNF